MVKDDKNRACLHALFVTNPLDDMQKIQDDKDKLVQGTCSWILGDPVYTKWLNEDRSQILWIHGDPGKGKTMLSTFLIAELRKRVEQSNNLNQVEAYFFCGNKDDRRNTGVAMLSGLLYQLLCQRPALFAYIQDEYEKQKDQLFSSVTALQTPWRIFEAMLKHSTDHTIYFIIDAMDECEGKSQNILISRIKSYVDSEADAEQSIGATSVNWLLTSHNDLREIMTDVSDICLESNLSNVREAVSKFVDVKVEKLRKQKNYGEELVVSIKKILEQKAEGTFLWVSLACAELWKVSRLQAKSKLEGLPLGLYPIYSTLLNRVLDNEDKLMGKMAKNILISVLVAIQPLTFWELAVMADIPTEWSNELESIRECTYQCGS